MLIIGTLACLNKKNLISSKLEIKPNKGATFYIKFLKLHGAAKWNQILAASFFLPNSTTPSTAKIIDSYTINSPKFIHQVKGA